MHEGLQSIRAEVRDLRVPKITQQEERLRSFESLQDAHAESLGTMNDALQSIRVQVQDLHSSTQAADAARLTKLENAIAELQQNMEFAPRMTALIKELMELAPMVEEQQECLTNLQSSRDEHTKSLGTLHEELQSIRGQSDSELPKAEDLASRMRTILDELVEVAPTIKEHQECLTNLQGSHDEHAKSLHTVHQDLKSIHAEVRDRHVPRIAQQEEDLRNLQCLHGEHAKNLGTMHEELQSIHAEVRDRDVPRITQQEESLRNLQSLQDEHANKLGTMHEGLQSLRAEVGGLSVSKIVQQEESLAKLQNLYHVISGRLGTMGEGLHSIQAEVQDLRVPKITQQEDSLRNLQSLHDEHAKSLCSMHEGLHSIQTEVRDLHVPRIAQQEERLRSLQSLQDEHAESLGTKIESLRNELRDEISRMARDYDSKDKAPGSATSPCLPLTARSAYSEVPLLGGDSTPEGEAHLGDLILLVKHDEEAEHDAQQKILERIDELCEHIAAVQGVAH